MFSWRVRQWTSRSNQILHLTNTSIYILKLFIVKAWRGICGKQNRRRKQHCCVDTLSQQFLSRYWRDEAATMTGESLWQIRTRMDRCSLRYSSSSGGVRRDWCRRIACYLLKKSPPHTHPQLPLFLPPSSCFSKSVRSVNTETRE